MRKKLTGPRILFFMVFFVVTVIGTATNINERVFAGNPMLSVKADVCMTRNPVIHGDFYGSGFHQNVSVTIQTNKNNVSYEYSGEPVTVLNTIDTDSVGNVTGSFFLDTSVGPREYREYFLHATETDDPRFFATASLDVCPFS